MNLRESKLNKEKAVELMALLGYNRESLLETEKKLVEDIEELEAQKNSRSIMICRHNTILTLELTSEYDNSKKISHVITTDRETQELKAMPIMEVSRYLDVSRWEPDTAKEWLQEELIVTNPLFTAEENEEYNKNYKKVTMGEYDFREIVLEDKRKFLSHIRQELGNETYLQELINS